MLSIIVKTDQPKQVVDITEQIEKEIGHFYIKQGLVHLMLFHTTAALTTANLDLGTDLDYIDAFEEMVPKLNYHAHNPKHVGDHILSSLIGTSPASGR